MVLGDEGLGQGEVGFGGDGIRAQRPSDQPLSPDPIDEQPPFAPSHRATPRQADLSTGVSLFEPSRPQTPSPGTETAEIRRIVQEYDAIMAARHATSSAGDSVVCGDADGDADLKETILGSDRVFSGQLIKVDHVDVSLPNGRTSSREVIRHPGATAIIALDGKGRILLVRQYRVALERVTREIPAGKLDLGEDCEACARRELSEETGYTAGTMRYLIPISSAVGYSDEIVHLFMATDLIPGEAHPDDGEFINVEWVDLGEFIDEVLDGKVEDSKTIIAALVCDVIARRLHR